MKEPRGPYDPFEDGKLCDCKDCVGYRKNHTKEEWLKEIGGENGAKSETDSRHED